MDSRSEQLIAQLNARIPSGVDWKAGALSYLSQLFVGDQRDQMRRFHLVKPFTTLQDPSASIRSQTQELARELAFFAHILSILELTPEARFLDVACGTGWVTHYLAKLGMRVSGFDISEDMISLARERMAADPWPTTDGRPLQVNLFCHDIETSPLPVQERFDVAILESALHHFVDPITTLRHLRESLTDDGIVIIIEGSSDGDDAYCREIMARYDTLERPYSPSELHDILVCAGFPVQQRLVPLSGFFHPGLRSARSVADLLCIDRSWNTVVAFNSIAAAEGSIRLQGAAAPPCYLTDASGDLVTDLASEHWIGNSADLVLDALDGDGIGLLFRSPVPNLTGQSQQLIISSLQTDAVVQRLELHPNSDGDAEITVVLPVVAGSAAYRLRVSEVFSPSWSDPAADPRLLGGRITIMPIAELPAMPAAAPIRSGLPADGWMGPDTVLTPDVNPGGTLQLRFISPLPCVRQRPQILCITVLPSQQCHRLTLNPEVDQEASAVFCLSDVPADLSLRIQSSDCFNPAWDGAEDDRLLSYRIELDATVVQA